MKWDEAQAIKYANWTYAPEVGFPPNLKQAYDRFKDAAEETPVGLTAKGKAAIADGEALFGSGSAATFHCFQLRKQAALDAERDLRRLGYSPTRGLIEAYLLRIGSWPTVLPYEPEVDVAVRNAEEGIPQSAATTLPRPTGSTQQGRVGRTLCLPAKDYDGWRADLRLIVRARLIHERALALREEYLELWRDRPPSVATFRRHVEKGLNRLHGEHLQIEYSESLEREVALAVAALNEFHETPDLLDRASRVGDLRVRLGALQDAILEGARGTRSQADLARRVNFCWGLLNGLLGDQQSPKRFESASPLRKHFEGLLHSLCSFSARDRVEDMEELIGASAADASEWRLGALEYRLRVADFLLEPRGSYLTGKRGPKQLGVWGALDMGLRRWFGPTYSEFAKSKAIAAAFGIYAGPSLVPHGAGEAKQFAVNSIEKLRRRLDLAQGEDILDQLRRFYVT